MKKNKKKGKKKGAYLLLVLWTSQSTAHLRYPYTVSRTNPTHSQRPWPSRKNCSQDRIRDLGCTTSTYEK